MNLHFGQAYNPYSSIGLTKFQIDQLKKINVSISNYQWQIVGSLNQYLYSTSSPQFDNLNLIGDLKIDNIFEYTPGNGTYINLSRLYDDVGGGYLSNYKTISNVVSTDAITAKTPGGTILIDDLKMDNITVQNILPYNGTNEDIIFSDGSGKSELRILPNYTSSIDYGTIIQSGNTSGDYAKLRFSKRGTASGEMETFHIFSTNTYTSGDLNVGGDLVVGGSVVYLNTETVQIKDNILVLNYGETGAGCTLEENGLSIDRGTETDYLFVFNETSDTFRIGEIGDTQAVCTREDAPTDTGILMWDDSNIRADTSHGYDLSSFTSMIMTGFFEWGGSGDYWSATGDSFTILRPLTGYIKSKKIIMAAPQSITLVHYSANCVYVDQNGVLQVCDCSLTDYEETMILYEVFYNGTNILVKNEQHPVYFQTDISRYIHNNIGSIIRDGGANLSVNGTYTYKLNINGEDYYEDHGLSTLIQEEKEITIYQVYKDGSGNWYLYAQSDSIQPYYNNAGTPTILDNNKFGVWLVYVFSYSDGTDNNIPGYISAMNTAQYNTQSTAETAVTDGEISIIDTYLGQSLEPARLGYVIFKYTGGNVIIQQIIISKSSISTRYIGGPGQSDHLLLTNINGGQYLDGGHTYMATRYESASDPTVNNDTDNFKTLSLWLNTTSKQAFMNVDNTDTAAIWRYIGNDQKLNIADSPSFTSIKTDTITEKTTNGGVLADIGDQYGNYQITTTKRNLGTSTYNILIGDGALSSTTPNEAINNIAIGRNALQLLTTGDSNIVIGSSAGAKLLTGTANILIGQGVGFGFVNDEKRNVSMGFGSMNAISTNDSTAYGHYAGSGAASSTSDRFCAFGFYSLYSLTSGVNNSAFGYTAGYDITTGSNNCMFGYNSDCAPTLNYQISIGVNETTTAAGEIRIGTSSNYGNITIGGSNTTTATIGGASTSLIVSNVNTDKITEKTTNNGVLLDIGDSNANYQITQTKRNFSSGTNNITIGNSNFGGSMTNPLHNIAIGTESLYSITSGAYNLGIGYKALYSNQSGNSNLALGYQCLYGITTGGYNFCFGYDSGKTITSGSFNICLGYSADCAATSNYQISIGADEQTSSPGEIRIGTTAGYLETHLGGSGTDTIEFGERLILDIENITTDQTIEISDQYWNMDLLQQNYKWIEFRDNFYWFNTDVWNESGTGSVINDQYGLTLTTGTTSTNTEQIDTNEDLWNIYLKDELVWEARILLGSTASMFAIIGLQSSTDFFGFRYDSSYNANWTTYLDYGSSLSYVDTGVAANLNWNWFRCYTYKSGGYQYLKWYINNNLVYSSLIASFGTNTFSFYSQVKTLTNSLRKLYIRSIIVNETYE